MHFALTVLCVLSRRLFTWWARHSGEATMALGRVNWGYACAIVIPTIVVGGWCEEEGRHARRNRLLLTELDRFPWAARHKGTGAGCATA